MHDVIIIGAGASGLIAAHVCGADSLKVLLLEGKPRPGLKLRITGGGRCNISNLNMSHWAFHSRHSRTVKNVLAAFSHRKTMAFFEAAGVALQAENDGCLFPAAQSAQVVLDALLDRLGPNVSLQVSRKVTGIDDADGLFRVSCGSTVFSARAVILCAGGRSYPGTGSDGSGYPLAERLGHTIVPLRPALTPLATDDADWKALAGISLPCTLRTKTVDGRDIRYDGPLLFTHFGFSGLCVLSISRHWIENPDHPVVANFLPRENDTAFRETILRAEKDHPRRMVKTWLSEYLPLRLAETVVKKAGLEPSLILGGTTRKQRENLIRYLFHCPLPVSGPLGYAKAEVTSGGVDLSEVDPKTLESRIVPRLFLAGEILDVDGPIGGYNLQWAWSSGVVAAKGVVEVLKS